MTRAAILLILAAWALKGAGEERWRKRGFSWAMQIATALVLGVVCLGG